MIEYTCQHCDASLETDDSLGMTAEPCPLCKRNNTVPPSKAQRREQKEQQRESNRINRQQETQLAEQQEARARIRAAEDAGEIPISAPARPSPSRATSPVDAFAVIGWIVGGIFGLATLVGMMSIKSSCSSHSPDSPSSGSDSAAKSDTPSTYYTDEEVKSFNQFRRQWSGSDEGARKVWLRAREVDQYNQLEGERLLRGR